MICVAFLKLGVVLFGSKLVAPIARVASIAAIDEIIKFAKTSYRILFGERE
jgi:hypothetical protein